MSTHKAIDKICVAITVFSLVLTLIFMNGKSFGLQSAARTLGYERTLFDTSKVHSIDIEIDDWDAFCKTATQEVYSSCNVIIDNKAVKNAAIRAKGNTSLSTVASLGSSRYSLKIEFDHYQEGKTYYGLDKLCLNNIIQDHTYMKDYLAYTMMREFGVDAPLCSYVYVTVNGEDWGLFLAVEGIEDSFLERVYSGKGDLYKPDSMKMGGGGPGKGVDFDMDAFMDENSDLFGRSEKTEAENTTEADATGFTPSSGEQTGGQGGDASGFTPSSGEQTGGQGGDASGFTPSSGEQMTGDPGEAPSGDAADRPEMPGNFGGDFPGGGFPGGGFGGMGGSDVKLVYSDDDPDSYSNIFDSAKTKVTKKDKTRLIESLKKLNENEDLEDVLNIDEVLRYFVVHNFTVNSDSYTGAMVHNYYLYENDGKFSMIPWDYNLGYGTFMAGRGTSSVNDPIDTPLETSGDGSRPMSDWIAQNEAYTELYHAYFSEFLDTVDMQQIIDETYEMIREYVEKDPTAFCTYDEFETGVETLKEFCKLRVESIRGQLDGSIPSTKSGQNADSTALIDASDLDTSLMGSMNTGMGTTADVRLAYLYK